MRRMRVVPIQIVGNVRPGRAPAVVGLQVDAIVFDTAPQAVDEDVVRPGATPVHGQLAAVSQHDIGEFHRRELAALVGVDDFGRALPG